MNREGSRDDPRWKDEAADAVMRGAERSEEALEERSRVANCKVSSGNLKGSS